LQTWGKLVVELMSLVSLTKDLQCGRGCHRCSLANTALRGNVRSLRIVDTRHLSHGRPTQVCMAAVPPPARGSERPRRLFLEQQQQHQQQHKQDGCEWMRRAGEIETCCLLPCASRGKGGGSATRS